MWLQCRRHQGRHPQSGIRRAAPTGRTSREQVVPLLQLIDCCQGLPPICQLQIVFVKTQTCRILFQFIAFFLTISSAEKIATKSGISPVLVHTWITMRFNGYPSHLYERFPGPRIRWAHVSGQTDTDEPDPLKILPNPLKFVLDFKRIQCVGVNFVAAEMGSGFFDLDMVMDIHS